jgi:hypothetical protein
MGSSAVSESAAAAGSSIPSEVLLLNWPLVQDGWRSVVYATGTFAVATAAGLLSHSVAMALLTGLVLVVAMWRFWLPVRFQLTAEGISQFCLGRRRLIPWLGIVRYAVLPRGVLLFFDPGDSPLSWLSTLYLGWRGEPDRVLAMVDFFTRNGRKSQGSSRVQRPRAQ